jgi:hypothetical protein
MSHTSEINFEANDLDVMKKTCEELGFGFAVNQNVKLYDGSRYDACSTVQLPDWRFPVVIKDGKLYFDNYNGHWGSTEKLHDLQQHYQAGVIAKSAARKGLRVTKKKVGDEIKVVVSR